MQKILHITNYYYPHVGGIESTTRNIVDILRETNLYEQKIICFGDGPNIVDAIPVIRLPYKLKISSQAISLKYKSILKRTILDFKPDLVIIHTPNPLVEHYFNKVHYKGKIVVFHHLDIYRQKILRHFVKPVTNKTNKNATVIIATSQKYIDGSKELLNYKDKCRVIPLCYKESELILNEEEKNKVKEIRSIYKDKTIVFYSGRHAKFKGVNYALKALKGMDNVIFLIGRVGPRNRLLEKQISLSKNAISLGLLDRDNYRIYLNTCDIFVFPSLTKNESFGITLLEAISLGKPCITFNIPGSGVNYVSLNNITGIECDNKNVIEFRKAINELKENKDLRETLSLNGIKRAKEIFSYDRFKESIMSLINDLLNNN